MQQFIDIRPYRSDTFEIHIKGLKRLCPLINTGEDFWIVGNEHLSFGTDLAFTRKVGKLLAEKLREFHADTILTAEVKSLGIAYEVSQKLKHDRFALARKRLKPFSKKAASVRINSITSAKQETLFLDEINLERIRGGNLILLDDVISTGSTMKGLMALAEKAKARICAVAAVWIEGPWPFERFYDVYKDGKLIYLGVLPIFARGNVYNKLCFQKKQIEAGLNG
jgi:adenine phosphoribosyltransferase